MSVDHQSIGEVLAALRGDFPDITISKIRFLESQGLIDPERTPSGYRKFREGDVARLRWILHQQKDNFLPLKVIKARLDEVGPDGLPADVDPAPGDEPVAPPADTTTTSKVAPAPTKPAKAPRAAKPRKTTARPAAAAKAPAARRAPATRAGTNSKPSERTATTPPMFETPMLPLDDGVDDSLAAETSGASLTRAELVTASGLTAVQLTELEEYGLVAPAAGSGERVVFDEDALVVAKLASEFAAHGIGPRHLRMFHSFAEREAGLYDQVIAPRLGRKNPEARALAREDLVDLARLGRALRAVFLRRAAGGLLRDRPAGPEGRVERREARCRVAAGGGAVIRVTLVGVRVEVPSNQPIVLLREFEGGQRYLPIFIGSPEATAIVYALQGMDTPRPMTHDLFVTVLGDFDVMLRQVAITGLRDGTFYAELELARGDEVQRISARPSDAIALAVRCGDSVPIVVDEEVFDEAGVLFEEEQEEDQIEEFRAFLEEITPEDFASRGAPHGPAAAGPTDGRASRGH